MPAVSAAPNVGDAQPEFGALERERRFVVADVLREQFLGTFPRLLGAGFVDVFGALRRVGKDGDLVREHLEEPSGDEQDVFRLAVANHHLAGPERCQQRDVVREHAEIALDSRCEHEVRLLAEDAALSRDELDLKLGHRGYSFSVSSGLASAAASFVAGALAADSASASATAASALATAASTSATAASASAMAATASATAAPASAPGASASVAATSTAGACAVAAGAPSVAVAAGDASSSPLDPAARWIASSMLPHM